MESKQSHESQLLLPGLADFMIAGECVEVKLLSYFTKYISGSIKLSAHDEVKWVSLKDIKNYNFPPADIPIIKKIIQLNGEHY